MASRRLLWCVLAAASAACAHPFTDIVATNTERVGDYDVVATSTTRDTLAATVCVAQPSRADAVAERIIEQLMNHGYRTITLNVVRSDSKGSNGAAAVTQVVWSARDGVREAAGGPAPAIGCRESAGRVTLTHAQR